MRTLHSIVTLACGVTAGIAFTLSCGDDNHQKADANDAPTCDCPAAELPIKARITEKKVDFTIPANTTQLSRGIACPGTADIVLNGGCIANQNDNILLRASFPEGFGWVCVWSNTSSIDVTVTGIVHCIASPQ